MGNSDIQGIDLDQVAGLLDRIVPRLACRMRPTNGAATSTTEANRLMELAREMQPVEHAPNHRDTELMPLSGEQDTELRFPHVRILHSEGRNGQHLTRRPLRWGAPMRTMRVILQTAESGRSIAITPTVEGGPADGEVTAGQTDVPPVRFMPPKHGELALGGAREGVFLTGTMHPGPGS